MNVLLVQPRVSAEPAYPLALAAMIPLLEAAGHTVFGADLSFDSLADVRDIAQRGSTDWIGATVLAHTADQVGELFRDLTARTTAQTFVAGALPTLDPVAALRRTGADVAVVGAPEDTVAALIGAPDPLQIPGCVIAEDGRVTNVRRAPSRVPTALHALPPMDRTVFPVERYGFAMRSTAVPYTATFTSRGCRRLCPYCAVPALRPNGFDARPPEQIHAEFRRLATDHGIRCVHIEDDSFLANRSRVLALCDLLRRDPIDVQWELVNGVRPTQFDGPLISAMAAAGCSRIVLSVEHIVDDGSPAVGHRWDQVSDVVHAARRYGMRVGGYFIIGLPGIGARETLHSVCYALRLRLDDANFVPFYVAPGSSYATGGDALEATRLSTPHAAWLAKAAQGAFFGEPQAFQRLITDMFKTPRTLPALASKAWELLRHGGPVPVRDAP